MTCIVGTEKDGDVFIGGDRAAATQMSIIQAGRSKVFRKGPFLIGYSGSFRFGQVVEHLMGIPPHPSDAEDLDYIIGGVIEHLRYCLKTAGVVDTTNAVETSKGTMLIGYNGKLYEMDGDFQCLPRSPAAIGSGWMAALGVFHYVSNNETDKEPQMILKSALEAATDLNPFVLAPYDILSLPKDVGRAPEPRVPRNIHNLWGLTGKRVI